jgi:hypothetical protein
MKRIIICFSLLLFVFTLKAQTQEHEPCGYQHEVDKILEKHPNFLQWQEAIYQHAMEEYADIQSGKRKIVGDTHYYEIPVVFHVLYNGANAGTENINVSYINSQMNELNLAFRKLTSDTSRIRPIFKAIAADVRIQFVLATKDPDGNPTTGITRTQTSKTTFATNIYGAYNDDMKHSNRGGKDAWNPARYLNIWTCNMRYPNQVSMTLGFATPPTGAPNWFGNVTKDSTDVESGVVMHFSVVGRNNPLAIANNVEGKTAIHEIGHYLGLRHIWGDGQGNNGCNVDDGLFDTPNARDKNYSCSKSNPPNTCNTGSGDLPDMTENYMDYALDGCAAMFTKQQAFLMRYVLNNFRTGLPYREITYDTIFDQTVGVEMFPNPTRENQDVKLQISGPEKSKYSVSIIDMSGKQVITRTATANQLELFDISGLARSVYYVIITDADNKIIDRKPLVIL